MDFWRDSPYRLRIAANILGPRVQFLIAVGLLAAVVAQTGIVALWSYPILAPLALWIAIVLWRRSVWVVVERDYQRVTIESRRILGFVTFDRTLRELRELQSIPVTARHRSQPFGGETTWTFHFIFGDGSAVPIGSVGQRLPQGGVGSRRNSRRRGGARHSGSVRSRQGAAPGPQSRPRSARHRPDRPHRPDSLPSRSHWPSMQYP